MALQSDGSALASNEQARGGTTGIGSPPGRFPVLVRGCLLIIVIVGAWLPRALGTDRLVTPDEQLWFAWSAEFAESLGGESFANSAQLVYPGVTLMWLATASFLTQDAAYPSEVLAQLDAAGSTMVSAGRAEEFDWLGLLERLRALVIVVNVALLATAYLQATRLFGVGTALLGTLLVAFEPYHVALGRVFQVDGLTGSLIAVSLLGILCYLYRGRSWIDLVVSAGAGALAMLTRSTSVLLAAFFALLVAREWWLRREQGSERFDGRNAAFAVSVWTAAIFGTCVALWPALRSDLLATLAGTVEAGLGKAGATHEWQTFFNGTVYQANPEWLFYPVAFLWRTTPATLIGLGLATALFLLPWSRAKIGCAVRQPLLAILTFVVLFVVVLTISPKKFDRYLISIFAPLALVSAWGWIETARQLATVAWLQPRRRWSLWLLVLAPLIIQVATLAQSFPYYFSHYNPLLGGAPRAVEKMMVGWGEGFDQIASYLNDQPDARTTTVLAGPWSSPFSYFFDGTALTATYADRSRDSDGDLSVRAGDPLLQWVKSDYRIVYVSEWQRKMIPESLLAYFAQRTPVMTVTIQGLEYARLYDIRRQPLPETFLADDSLASDWGGTVRLVAHELSARSVKAGGSVTVTTYVEDLGLETISSGRLRLVLKIVDESGFVVVQSDAALHLDRSERSIWPVDVRARLPTHVAPGRYRLELVVHDSKNNASLAWSPAGLGKTVDAPFVAGSVMVKERVMERGPTETADGDQDGRNSTSATGRREP